MAQILHFHAHREYPRGPIKPFIDIPREQVEESFRLPVSIFAIRFGRRPSIFCDVDDAAHKLLAALNLIESNELFEIGRAWILDTLYAKTHLPRLRDFVLLTKKQSIKDAFYLFRSAMRENADISLPNLGLISLLI